MSIGVESAFQYTKYFIKNSTPVGASLVIQQLSSYAGAPGWIPDQGTRPHMPKVKIPSAATKTWCTKYIIFFFIKGNNNNNNKTKSLSRLKRTELLGEMTGLEAEAEKAQIGLKYLGPESVDGSR